MKPEVISHQQTFVKENLEAIVKCSGSKPASQWQTAWLLAANPPVTVEDGDTPEQYTYPTSSQGNTFSQKLREKLTK